MAKWQIKEYAAADDLFENPIHPYTHILLAAVPDPEAGKKALMELAESDRPEQPAELPEGCRFQAKCQETDDRCRLFNGELAQVGKEHFVRCWKT